MVGSSCSNGTNRAALRGTAVWRSVRYGTSYGCKIDMIDRSVSRLVGSNEMSWAEGASGSPVDEERVRFPVA